MPPVLSNGLCSPVGKKSLFEFQEVEGDLFSTADSLVHCVSRDLRMGKGISKLFRDKFGKVDEMKAQGKGTQKLLRTLFVSL